MWKNKHVILAFLVAPMLAIIAWFAVDYFVAERPQAARPGAAYPLVAKPNCRRLSAGCDLANEDFRLRVVVTQFDPSGAEIELTAGHSLAQAAVGVANSGGEDGAPTALRAADEEGRLWRGRVAGVIGADSMLRVAVSSADSTFYAEIPVTFFYDSGGTL